VQRYRSVGNYAMSYMEIRLTEIAHVGSNMLLFDAAADGLIMKLQHVYAVHPFLSLLDMVPTPLALAKDSSTVSGAASCLN